jgi:hypothetical protein
MGHSYHSRFSITKRKRRERREEKRLHKMSGNVQGKQKKNASSYPAEEILRELRMVHRSLPNLPQQDRSSDTAGDSDAGKMVLESDVRLSEHKGCPCCGLVFQD